MHHIQMADNLAVGTQIAGYIIDEKIGKGGMGSVYRAKHLALGREIALKVLSEDFCRDEDAVANFFKEARSVANLRHKNIIQAYDVGTSETGLHYFAMELVEGRDLNEIIHDFDKVPEDYAISIAMDMAGALKHAWHRNSLSHGDIKPENIMYTFNREVKITDFGLARSLHDELDDDDIMLTPAYAAPELISRATSRISPSTDIYSFGITLYHMLAGHPPFEGDDYQEIYRRHLNEVAPPLSSMGVSKSLSDFVEMLIKKNPHDRFDNWDIIVEELEIIQTTSTVQPLYVMLGKVAAIIVVPLIVFAVVWSGSQKEVKPVVVRDLAPVIPSEESEVASTSWDEVFETSKAEKQTEDEAISENVASVETLPIPKEEAKVEVSAESVETVGLGEKPKRTELPKGRMDDNGDMSSEPVAETAQSEMESQPQTKEPLNEEDVIVATRGVSPADVDAELVVDDAEEAAEEAERLQKEQARKAHEARKQEFLKLVKCASSSTRYFTGLDEAFSKSGISNRLRRLKGMLDSIDVDTPFSSDIREHILFLTSQFEHLKSSYRIIIDNKDSLIGVKLKTKPLDGYVVKSVTSQSLKLYKTINNASAGRSSFKTARIGKTISWKKVSDDLVVELLVAVRMGDSDLGPAVKDSILMKVLVGGAANHFQHVTSFEDSETAQIWNGIYYDIKRCDKEVKYGEEWRRILELCKEGYSEAGIGKLIGLERLTANTPYHSRNEKMFSLMKVLYTRDKPTASR